MLRTFIDTLNVGDNRWGPPLVDEDWLASYQAIHKGIEGELDRYYRPELNLWFEGRFSAVSVASGAKRFLIFWRSMGGFSGEQDVFIITPFFCHKNNEKNRKNAQQCQITQYLLHANSR